MCSVKEQTDRLHSMTSHSSSALVKSGLSNKMLASAPLTHLSTVHMQNHRSQDTQGSCQASLPGPATSEPLTPVAIKPGPDGKQSMEGTHCQPPFLIPLLTSEVHIRTQDGSVSAQQVVRHSPDLRCTADLSLRRDNTQLCTLVGGEELWQTRCVCRNQVS